VAEETKAKFNPKVIIIGVPLYIIQLVAVYFIAVNFLVKEPSPNNKEKEETEHTENAEGSEGGTEEGGEGGSKPKTDSKDIGKNLCSFDDIIVNPAGTNGQKLMLTSISFDMTSPEALNLMKEREQIIKDLIITTLSNKTLDEINKQGFKDTLKIELASNIKKTFKDLKIRNVYFTKYIIQ